MKNYNLLSDAGDLAGKKVLLRAGFDVPMEGGKVADASRIEAVVPTMQFILRAGAALIIMSHQGRPDGKVVKEMSQRPLTGELKKLLGANVEFADDCVGAEAENAARNLSVGEVLLLENLRFHAEEKANDPDFSAKLASLADVYVNDAFTNAHRNHASMVGVTKHLPSYMGLNLQSEVENLSRFTENPKRPVTLVISGKKMETKVPVIEGFMEKGDDILLGGCIANTFLAASGAGVGKSLFESGGKEQAKAKELLLESGTEGKATIHIPEDAKVAADLSPGAEVRNAGLEEIGAQDSIFDIGDETAGNYAEIIARSKTIIWNGPAGMSEDERFSKGTIIIAQAVRKATKKLAISVIGGGDTIGFHEKYGVSMGDYTFVSTGGGAMLEFLAGEEFPSLAVLEKKT